MAISRLGLWGGPRPARGTNSFQGGLPIGPFAFFADYTPAAVANTDDFSTGALPIGPYAFFTDYTPTADGNDTTPGPIAWGVYAAFANYTPTADGATQPDTLPLLGVG